MSELYYFYNLLVIFVTIIMFDPKFLHCAPLKATVQCADMETNCSCSLNIAVEFTQQLIMTTTA